MIDYVVNSRKAVSLELGSGTSLPDLPLRNGKWQVRSRPAKLIGVVIPFTQKTPTCQLLKVSGKFMKARQSRSPKKSNPGNIHQTIIFANGKSILFRVVHFYFRVHFFTMNMEFPNSAIAPRSAWQVAACKRGTRLNVRGIGGR